MKIFSEIHTERLILRIFTLEYLTNKYVDWLNDSEVVKYSEQRHKLHTLSTCREYYESFKNQSNLFLVILIKDNLEHVGNITVLIDKNNLVADVAILIGEKTVWGEGYGKEAFVGIMNYLLQNSVVRKVTAGTMSINKPMLAIMHSSGMVADGVRRGQFIVDGKEVDMVMTAAWS